MLLRPRPTGRREVPPAPAPATPPASLTPAPNASWPTLEDETGKQVQSEKQLEVDFANDRPARDGDQFAIGQKPQRTLVVTTYLPQAGFTSPSFSGRWLALLSKEGVSPCGNSGSDI